MKYFGRLRVRRVYRWSEEPLRFNRKLKTFDYRSLAISVDGLPGVTVITTGQHILIEGKDEDSPYVARVMRLFGDESGKQKKASIRWFIRTSEIPTDKLKLLGREPHTQEIFYYQSLNCEEEVDVESILRPVQVKHLDSAAPFPDSDGKDTLYVKLSWDCKAFMEVDSTVVESMSEPALTYSLHPHASRRKPSLPPLLPCSPPAAAPASRAPSCHALPMPDPSIMHRAASGEARYTTEVESMHSATKLSASKCLSAKRRNASSRTPGVRKKLELSSPEKISCVDAVDRLLDEEPEALLAQRLSSSPPQALPLSHRLTPLRKSRRTPTSQYGVPVSPSLVLNRVSVSDINGHTSPSKDDASRAMTPSRRHPKTLRIPTLGVLAEVIDEKSQMMPAATTPRSSKRKSAQLVSDRIRKQLNLLDNHQELNSDCEDEEEFVPSKKELQSSSEGEEESGLESDEVEVVAKRNRRIASGSLTPRSKQHTRSSNRTPQKTPSKKITISTPRTPRHATPSIPSRSLPARQPANVLEEARARLHVSSVPESLPCREQEFQDVYSFVESKIIDGTGGCMYISGVPGTGKTATIHEVMRCLQHAADVDEIPPFHFIEINGMKMTDPHQAYVQILQKLTGEKATADHAAVLLEKRFSNPAPKKKTTVLLVDELDLLWTRKQNVMYNLFDWPTRRHAHLVVLTIANTMDLPERIMINRVASRLGLTRMSFQPYSFKQLQQIITSRLNKVKAFEEDALQLVSRKLLCRVMLAGVWTSAVGQQRSASTLPPQDWWECVM
ncbi:origin recognition complex subunit 1 isoform X2 [Echeneis naucrates]|uniref:origin recognition complex subunit 1 isoform X2 n=1 Tax=Echeneis naucrates TaxID=173247 RepID=UPI0011141DDE|nr:origin recognition complex subunit 1 isoform X2 [Echeneis naucrates]